MNQFRGQLIHLNQYCNGGSMSKDISTKYTKYKNKNCGRNYYARFVESKIKNITPREYGEFKNMKGKVK